MDIGGGVPNNYHGEDDSVDFAKYKTDVLGTVHIYSILIINYKKQYHIRDSYLTIQAVQLKNIFQSELNLSYYSYKL